MLTVSVIWTENFILLFLQTVFAVDCPPATFLAAGIS